MTLLSLVQFVLDVVDEPGLQLAATFAPTTLESVTRPITK